MNRIILLFATYFIAAGVVGQNFPKTILWEVTKKGNKHKSYLFGTFHEVSPAFFASLTNSESKLNQSQVLYVEEQAERGRDSLSFNSIYQSQWDYRRWKTVLTDKQDSVFNAFVKKSEDSSYYNLSPTFLAITVSRLYLKVYCEMDSTSFNTLMDNYIEELAIRQNKKIYSLDENQANLLKKENDIVKTPQYSSSALSTQFMRAILNDDFSYCYGMNSYKKFELNYEFETDFTQKTDDFVSIVKGNNKWLSILSPSFLNNNCFVAVGIRHLFYKQGLIQQLKNLGYIVKPVSP